MLPITDLIRQRYSCRFYEKKPIAAETARQLADYARSIHAGRLGTPLRFDLAAASPQDGQALRGLGTYGFIRNPAGFLIGAVEPGEKNLEDFGYAMEAILLFATQLGLGTCWLGGSFTRSSFSRKIAATKAEVVPAVASVGYPAERTRERDRIRQAAKSDHRLPWEAIFFQSGFDAPLSPDGAGAYALPLEMLRLAPSASNNQPWRIVQEDACYHFYIQRTPGYKPGLVLLGLADLQRVDLGIAMAHFELSAGELGLAGRWQVQEPDIPKPGYPIEYIVTYIETPLSSRLSSQAPQS
jgi:nitroreductase